MAKNEFLKVEGEGRLVFDFNGWIRSDEGRARLEKLLNHPITKALKAGKAVKTDEFGLSISITEQSKESIT